MNKNILILIPLIFALPVCAAAQASAAEQDFVPLFNGHDLQGWVNVNGAPETWTVREGLIVCSGTPYGVLRTDRHYQNYILELDWRHAKAKGNSGLFLHSDALPAAGEPFTRAIEVQIMDGNHGDVFAIQGATLTPISPHPKGWMRALPQASHTRPAGEWNHYRVESRDGMISLWVNGQLVTQAVNACPRKGYICLESEGSEIYFRNIRIKELPGEEPDPSAVASLDQGFAALYNGLDLRGWKHVSGNEGHWKPAGWILDYDGRSEAKGEDQNLWSDKEYEDFELIVDWKQTGPPTARQVPNVLPDGSQARNPDGTEVQVSILDAGDSGIYLRGNSKSQVNIWSWPIGSGEVYGFRTDEKMPPEVRRAVTPLLKADNPPGEWNRFHITLIADRLTVVLNGRTVVREARLPGIPKRGPLALQHHGDPVQFANIFIRKLGGD